MMQMSTMDRQLERQTQK